MNIFKSIVDLDKRFSKKQGVNFNGSLKDAVKYTLPRVIVGLTVIFSILYLLR